MTRVLTRDKKALRYVGVAVRRQRQRLEWSCPHTKKGLELPKAEGSKEGFSSAAFRRELDFTLLGSRTEKE